MPNKKPAKKKPVREVFKSNEWVIKYGELRRAPGRPPKQTHLFKVVAEKIPYEAFTEVRDDLRSAGHSGDGVYVAHDSMGCARYIGRGDVLKRLATHKKNHPRELAYFSFYIVADKNHEREVETLLIRSAGFLLVLNERKKRIGIAPGNVNDYEPGTWFYERQGKPGKKKSK